MLDTLINAFTKGDLIGFKSKLLHSTSWSQHNSKAYGADKLQRIVTHWLQLAGRCEVKSSFNLLEDENQVISLELAPIGSSETVTYSLWLETNGQVIKSVNAYVDTVQLANVNQQELETVLSALPEPDAFVLPDYDQQDHLQNELAVPSKVCVTQEDLSKLLDKWWTVWSNAQLSEIENIYSEGATVNLSNNVNHGSPSQLFDFVLSKYTRLTRVFAQLELVAVEGDKVAIKWYLDGDDNGERVRAPFLTTLIVRDSKIHSETTVCDILAYKKRFSQSKLFDV